MSALPPLEAWTWPRERLGEALELLATRAGLQRRAGAVQLTTLGLDDEETQLNPWLQAAAAQVGVEVEPVSTTFADLERFLNQAAPAIVRLPPSNAAPLNTPSRFFLLLRPGARPQVLGPDGRRHTFAVAALADFMRQELIGPWLQMAEGLLKETGIDPARRGHVSSLLLQEQFSAMEAGTGWLVRLAPGASLWHHALGLQLNRPLLLMLGAQLIQQALLVTAWWLIGQGTLQGALEQMWLYAWALLLLSSIPFQWLSQRATNQISLLLGALFKQRLLFGTLQLHPDEIRHQGMGQFLGRVMEAEAVEMLALNGGWVAVLALGQLVTAFITVSLGLGGLWLGGLLAGWVLLLGGLSALSFYRSRAWMHTYRQMTNDLVERMVGHRTRLAQEDPRTWHTSEDDMLERYLTNSREVDQVSVWLSALGRTWLLASLATVTGLFVSGPTAFAALAISLGGILLAYQALESVAHGLQNAIQFGLSWDEVAPLFNAAQRSSPPPVLAAITNVAQAAAPTTTPAPILLAKDLSFRYQTRSRWVLQECNLRLFAGDRVLLEGPSGGGKTTLAALLAGLRSPTSGTLLLHGFDQPSLGSALWRQRVVAAPQFHENHVFTETFGFNLLMGRQWPALPQDNAEAEALCRELGLGEVLDKMPSGLQQIVGESGWQLSHGERSRLFIARALLQKADLIIMDESFGALDPENLALALQCVLRRAPTLVVIAHP